MENNINQKLEDYIIFYKSLNNPQFAVLINGNWGSGKTYYIKNKLKEWNLELKTHKDSGIWGKICFWKKNSSENSQKIFLKPVYVSLYGISNTNQINEKIKEALNPLLYGKGAKAFRKIVFGAVKTATQINFDANGDSVSDGKVTFDINSLGLLKDKDERIKGEKLIVFDDVERCKIRTSELFGYINEFVEHYCCKIIMLSDENKTIDKCIEENEAYKEFKEKLIGQTFTIQADIENAVSAFINTISDSENKEYLKDSTDIIKSVFLASKISNLRILRQAILDFERFVNQLSTEVRQHKKYSVFVKNLLGHFILVYLEYKSGNDSIADIPKYKFTDAQRENESKIRLKYNETFIRLNIFNRNIIISYDIIVAFISHGFNNLEDLDSSIRDSYFFREKEEQNWEKLWRWEDLEDDEFNVLYENVVKYAKSTEADNPYILLHIIMTMVSLRKNNIIGEIEFDCVRHFKNCFEIILEKNKNNTFSYFTDHSWSKSYRKQESSEFKEIVSYANERIKSHNLENKDSYLVQVFTDLNDENIHELQDKLDISVPDRSSNYFSGAIFEGIDSEKLAKTLLNLQSSSLESFFNFIEKRYFPEKIISNASISADYTRDKKVLVDILGRISEDTETALRIRKFNLGRYAKLLEEAIQRLENLENKDIN